MDETVRMDSKLESYRHNDTNDNDNMHYRHNLI